MAIKSFWKVATGLVFLCLSTGLFAQIGTLSDGACWYDWNKEDLRIASFNDKAVYRANRPQIESEIEALLNHQKVGEMDLSLHCGGYGASLVAKVVTDNATYCLWSSFEKGKLLARSIGVTSDKSVEGQLCDGHKSGEFILGVNSKDFIAELRGPKWSAVIKEVIQVSEKVYKVVLMKDYETKEGDVATQLEDNFSGKNFIRYIEFNDYHHPVGEYVQLK